jgi:hypothetical protein
VKEKVVEVRENLSWGRGDKDHFEGYVSRIRPLVVLVRVVRK